MRVLGLDTSLPTGTVGLIDGVNVLYEEKIAVRPGGGEKIPALIQKALQSVGWRPKYLELVVAGKGPGSYTGVRVGLAVAKGLAYSLGIPLVSINTLLALAANDQGWPGLVCPVLDARRRTVYAGLYRRQEWDLSELRPPEVWPVEDLIEFLRRQKTPVLFLGDGAYRDELTAGLGSAVRYKREDSVHGAVLAGLGLTRWQKRKKNELYTGLPLYLRRTEAEIRREQRSMRGGCGS